MLGSTTYKKTSYGRDCIICIHKQVSEQIYCNILYSSYNYIYICIRREICCGRLDALCCGGFCVKGKRDWYIQPRRTIIFRGHKKRMYVSKLISTQTEARGKIDSAERKKKRETGQSTFCVRDRYMTIFSVLLLLSNDFFFFPSPSMSRSRRDHQKCIKFMRFLFLVSLIPQPMKAIYCLPLESYLYDPGIFLG